MDKALRATVVPWLRARGYVGGLPHFRRMGSTVVDVLTFVFDKWGGGFTVEIGQCPPEGIVTSWGVAIAPRMVNTSYLTDRTRISADDRPGTAGWFRFDREPPAHLAALLLAKLQELEK